MIEDLMDPNVQHGELGLMFTTLKVGAAQQIITIPCGPFCSRDNIIIVSLSFIISTFCAAGLLHSDPTRAHNIGADRKEVEFCWRPRGSYRDK